MYAAVQTQVPRVMVTKMNTPNTLAIAFRNLIISPLQLCKPNNANQS